MTIALKNGIFNFTQLRNTIILACRYQNIITGNVDFLSLSASGTPFSTNITGVPSRIFSTGEKYFSLSQR